MQCCGWRRDGKPVAGIPGTEFTECTAPAVGELRHVVAQGKASAIAPVCADHREFVGSVDSAVWFPYVEEPACAS